MESDQFPKYPQELEDDIGALSDYLFEKHYDVFDIFYLEECVNDDINMSHSNCTLIDDFENKVIQSS
jgi:hypothetical protein